MFGGKYGGPLGRVQHPSMRGQGRGPGVKMLNFYKTTVWKKKREMILRRDEYMCRECRRYGKTTPATTVHHIYPIEEYPQWRLESWNLISLCWACANAMHDRKTGKLTELGWEWQRRIPPHPND